MDFEYCDMIDSIMENDLAYRFLLDYIFDEMGFAILTKEDVTPPVLKEWFSRIHHWIPEKAKRVYSGTTDFYLYMLTLYFEDKLACAPGSRSEQYKKRARELIKQAKTDESLDLTFDTLLIFLSIFRTFKNVLDIITERQSVNPTIAVTIEDADFLSQIYKKESLAPFSHLLKESGDKGKALRFFYVNSIVLLTQMLQDRGFFNAEEC